MIVLAWPDKVLSPNARAHYHAKAKVAKAYREAAYERMMGFIIADAHGENDERWNPQHLSITFYPPDKRKRDLDNMLSSIKAGLDGIADALGVNDERFALTIRKGDPVKGGQVCVEVVA